MAVNQNLFTIGLAAQADLSAGQYYAVKLHSANKQVLLTAAETDIAIGILQNKPAAAGRAAEVAIMGISKAVAGEAITIGEKVGASTNGKLIEHDADGDTFIGIALTAAAADGDVFEVILTGIGYDAVA